MKLSLDQLSAIPEHYAYEVDGRWWESQAPLSSGLPGRVLEPFRVEIEAHEMGEQVHLEGSLRGTLEFECGRCLARYGEAIGEGFRVVIEPAGSRLPADPEAAAALERDGLCLGDDFEMGWYQGVEIQLDAFCREVISLALPVKPLCGEDCAGLCARCGADLNQGGCPCAQARPDSPFAVLAALRDSPEGAK